MPHVAHGPLVELFNSELKYRRFKMTELQVGNNRTSTTKSLTSQQHVIVLCSGCLVCGGRRGRAAVLHGAECYACWVVK